METRTTFRCLRCGHEFEESFDPKAPLLERSCPKCKSNSVRRLKPQAGGAKA